MEKQYFSLWFKKNIYQKMIPAGLLLLSIMTIVFVLSLYASFENRNLQLDTFSKIIEQSIFTKNLSIMEKSALLLLKSLNGDKISVCNEVGKTLWTFPDENISYRKNDLFNVTNRRKIGNSEQGLYLLISLPIIPNTFLVMIFALCILSFIILLYYSFISITKKLSFELNYSFKNLIDESMPLKIKEFDETRLKLINYQNEVKRNANLVAIGQTTAMLAHDVRKPFSMIKMIVDRFDSFKNNPSSLKTAKEDVDKSIKHVEGMISDIMDFSREVKLETNPASIVTLLDFSIRLVAQAHKDSNIDLIYDLNHTFKPLVDDERMSRVLSNVITNGIEAIRDIGRKERGIIGISVDGLELRVEKDVESLKFKAEGEDLKRFVRIRIANDGPVIKEEDIPKLFEPFFTKGKKKGTGLGLASCQKIINLHGGRISVRNCLQNSSSSQPNPNRHSRFHGDDSTQSGVEFIIDIPASNVKDTIDTKELPKNIRDIIFVEIKKDEAEIDKEIDLLAKENKRLKILLLEDEALYRASIRNTIKKNENLDKIITLYETNNIEDALNVIEKEEITHAIVDIDLGDIRNGFDFLGILKENYSHIKSLVHTNRCIQEDRLKAKALSAEGFVPKPLNIEHLVSFLKGERLFEGQANRLSKSTSKEKTRTIDKLIPSQYQSTGLTPVGIQPSFEKVDQVVKQRDGNNGHIILFSDDDSFMRMAVEDIVKEVNDKIEFYSFENGEKLLDKLKTLNGERVTVLTDQNMGTGITGLELTKEIKQSKIQCKIFMISNEMKDYFEEKALSAGADGYLEAPVMLETLKEIIF